MNVIELLIIFIIYLFSSLHSGYLITKYIFSKNIYDIGFESSGFSNVYRQFGLKFGIFVGLYDCLIKGFLPIYLLHIYKASDLLISFSALFIILGHLFSPYHKFKGGRGILSNIGIGFALGWFLEIMLVIVIFKLFELFLWRNNALSTFLGIITFMFVIPIAFEKNIFIICFELIFLLLLFKRIITNNINMNVNLDIILKRILYDTN
tara:strand:+ start:8719 stop:9339 length:621 start_codon:yes stop_codon:yes gene_type:complete